MSKMQKQERCIHRKFSNGNRQYELHKRHFYTKKLKLDAFALTTGNTTHWQYDTRSLSYTRLILSIFSVRLPIFENLTVVAYTTRTFLELVRENFEFICHQGLYSFLWTSFGLWHAIGTFQRATVVILAAENCLIALNTLKMSSHFQITVKMHSSQPKNFCTSQHFMCDARA